MALKEDVKVEVVSVEDSWPCPTPLQTIAAQLGKRRVNYQPHPKTDYLYFSLATAAATQFLNMVGSTARITNRHEGHCIFLAV